MKKYLVRAITFLLVGGLMFSGAVLAKNEQGKSRADGFGGPPSATEKLARLSEMLDLGPEQEAAMLLVLQETEKQRAYLHEQAMNMFGEQICANRADAHQQVLSILTEEQAAVLEEKQQERSARAEERGSRRGGDRLDCS